LVASLPLTDGQWLFSRRALPDDPAQGWKLHVSATVLSAAEVFRRARPILRKHRALFKVPRRVELLGSLNAGLPEFSQVGKFLTIYPRSTDEALILARELHGATRGLAGPRVPFDAPYRSNSLVYYRYGAFRRLPRKAGGLIRGPNGRLQRDKRGRGQAVPPWLDDPFNPTRPQFRKTRGPIGLDYFVSKAITQRGKGGVYEAVDLSVSPARLVIIKEGRRHGETDLEGRDGYERLRHEARVLRRLRKVDLPVPKVFREFCQNGNRYLVLEHFLGKPLIPAARMQPVKTSWRRAAEIMDRLEPLLARIHAAGWVWRDCKPSHLLVDRGQLRLIDFENACRLGENQIAPWVSRHYFPPPRPGMRRRRPGSGEDDYALAVIGFQFGTGQFPPSKKTARAVLYRRTKCPKSLRERIERLIDSTI
jgi:tRNA A-37 threonylcarbamoyl transferase component Bud32